MKIGILGGTFNPIHTGHLILAENAYEFMGLDQVLFIPSGVSYLKDMNEILPAHQRLKLVELAIVSNPHFALSTIETDRKGNSYTYETLKELKAQNPDAELYFICGADVMMSIHTWKEPATILKYASLVVAPRNDTDPDLMNRQKEALAGDFQAKVYILNTAELDISSSMIRDRLIHKKSVRYYLPDPVIAYIQEHKLYEPETVSEKEQE